MRFENRTTFTSKAGHRRKWLRYWRQLSEEGFGLGDPFYRYFVGEVFHDGEVMIQSVDLPARQVVLRLRNVHALDAITAEDAYREKPFAIDRSDFQTRVVFAGVERFRVRTKPSISDPIYVASQLSKAGDKSVLQIAFMDETGGDDTGIIRLEFASAEVEDIAPKISKYAAAITDRTLSPIVHDPHYYEAELRSAS